MAPNILRKLKIQKLTRSCIFSPQSFVQRRNEKVIKAAARSTAIVSSLFPSNVRDRLYKEQEEKEKNRQMASNLKSFLRDGGNSTDDCIAITQSSSKPLADLFPETTVLVRSSTFCTINNFWQNAMILAPPDMTTKFSYINFLSSLRS
jgi:hypothetical protein